MNQVKMLCDSCAVRTIRAGRAVPHARDPAHDQGVMGIRYTRIKCDICDRMEDCSRTTVETENR